VRERQRVPLRAQWPDRGPHRRGGSSVALLARPSRTVRQRSAARKPQRRRRSGGSAKSALFARLRPEDSQSPSILAMHAATNASADRTSANARRELYPDYEATIVSGRALYDKSARNNFRNLNPCIAHPQPESEPNRRIDFIKSESGPLFPTNPGPVSVIIDRSKSPGSVQRFLSIHAAVTTRSTSSVISLPAASFASEER
jgi:hypothetical protein